MVDTTSSVQRPATQPLQTVRDILHPRSVAIVGASDSDQKWGGRLLRYMLRHRHDGPPPPTNPLGWQPCVAISLALDRGVFWDFCFGHAKNDTKFGFAKIEQQICPK